MDAVSTKPRIDKLGVKEDSVVVVLGVRDADFLDEVCARTESVTIGRRRKNADLIFFLAERPEELDALEGLEPLIKRNGAIWVVSPKGKGARIRDTDVIDAAKRAGLVDNKVVSFSPALTSLRLVVPLSRR